VQLPVINNEATEAPKGGCSAGSCGSTDDQMGHLPENIRQKVFNHPCYSEEAHHYFARMHVAVAPACNIQCNYCNRKYDCANESRPGVVSELHHPVQAVKKVLAVAATIPQMTVLGIAGPGDPLANPERTFETFRMLSEQAPDIKLCFDQRPVATRAGRAIIAVQHRPRDHHHQLRRSRCGCADLSVDILEEQAHQGS